MSEQELRQAMGRAFNLGQTYWQQADSEYSSQWRKADATQEKFRALVDETVEKLCAALSKATGSAEGTTGGEGEKAQVLSDERILHLWDVYVGYESHARSAQKLPLSKEDKLQFARAVLSASAAKEDQQ